MGYTNSPLVNYVKLSPNNSGQRNHDIDTLTIHCVVGQCSVETLGRIFASPSRRTSSNYGVGVDGRIGMYCEEKNRSWCTSSNANDQRAITIEVASDNTHPYAVNSKAFAGLLDLVTDICNRNVIKKLVWSTNKNDRVNHLNGCNMTVHRDYANKSCPGDYLYNRHGEIAAEVNQRLNATEEPPVTENETVYVVVPGDTLSKIANKYGTTYQKLAQYNNIANPNVIYVGRKIRIPGTTPASAPVPKKSADEIAKEVIAGKWGNGAERKQKLTDAGYDYFVIQEAVNSKLNNVVPEKPKKSIDEIAIEVIRGDWGNGATRNQRLTDAGYDYSVIQKRVNELV